MDTTEQKKDELEQDTVTVCSPSTLKKASKENFDGVSLLLLRAMKEDNELREWLDITGYHDVAERKRKLKESRNHTNETQNPQSSQRLDGINASPIKEEQNQAVSQIILGSLAKLNSYPSSKMKILFLTTAHNSLSQRLYLSLADHYTISIEYAISSAVMIEAVQIFEPDLIVCPFLTAKVPEEIYNSVMTLIIHPGPPGDAGPSALDWLLIGDNGFLVDAEAKLQVLDHSAWYPRGYWGVSIIQATEKFDAGPVWAFDQFPIDIDEPGLTKSSLYRGPVTQAAISATKVSISRLVKARDSISTTQRRILPSLVAEKEYFTDCISTGLPFLGGITRKRPLLKAADRNFDIHRHTATQISRRIRSADSQPGVQSKIFGPSVYLYGGIVDNLENIEPHLHDFHKAAQLGDIIMIKSDAVCIKTCDLKGIWITHIRRLKRKGKDTSLWPKVTAVFGLLELGIISAEKVEELKCRPNYFNRNPRDLSTFQESWVVKDDQTGILYVHFEFYNGAMSTQQCKDLHNLIFTAQWRPDDEPDVSASKEQIKAIVLMGGSYFSNGIALNVIEGNPDPAQESWENITAIDDLIQYIITLGRDKKILTVAAVRGNAAAGGVALMAACDYVICDSKVVLNPAYRGIGLYGSEFHTLSFYGRCGNEKARMLLRDMLPIRPRDAGKLVDDIFDSDLQPGKSMDTYVKERVWSLLCANFKPPHMEISSELSSLSLPPNLTSNPLHKEDPVRPNTLWTFDPETTNPKRLREVREKELAEMKKDFWGPRSKRYHTRRFDFVRKVKMDKTPLRFAVHRRGEGMLDEEERDEFDDDGVTLEEVGGENDVRNDAKSVKDIKSKKGDDDEDKSGQNGIETGVESVEEIKLKDQSKDKSKSRENGEDVKVQQEDENDVGNGVKNGVESVKNITLNKEGKDKVMSRENGVLNRAEKVESKDKNSEISVSIEEGKENGVEIGGKNVKDMTVEKENGDGGKDDMNGGTSRGHAFECYYNA